MTDVAIIGLACRFPGAANPRDFWGVIRDGREATQLPGDVAEFDADFFNLSPREACAMDPRQRLALELTWEAFEDAFVVPETVRGTAISVYFGAMADDYAVLTLRDIADNLDHHSFAGISRGMIANRVSYAFGLHGPSLTVDSGQSSSLVAVHLACESLRSGESALAIAGGVHLNLADETAMLEREFGALSTSGHTYAFDRRADGYVRGEGGGLVLLKPLPTALRDGDRIHAVIRGTAVGNSGHSAAGQTAPSVSGEADVIRRALAAAGLGITDVDYIEAHGTGTKVGDAVEARALGEVFGAREHPVQVGSVKTNIGHAGGAAGIAGLLKTVLAVRHSVLPPSLNYADADPEFERLGLRVNTAALPLAGGGPSAPRRGVLIRDGRHQRARHRGTGAPTSGYARGCARRAGCVGAVGSVGAGPGQPGAPAGGAGGRLGGERGGRGVVAGDDALGVRPSGGAGRSRPRGADARPGRAGGRGAGPRGGGRPSRGRRARRRLCSPAKARNGPEWAANSTNGFRPSPALSTRPRRRWTLTCGCRCAR